MKLFCSEFCSEGHPDKVCDIVSDSILDECLKVDPNAHVAVETLATSGRIVLAGEVSPSVSNLDFCQIALNTISGIGYNSSKFYVSNLVHCQSSEINSAVSQEKTGAGDIGMMFGYAVYSPATNFLPPPLFFARRIIETLTERRKNGCEILKPDAKCEVLFDFDSFKVQKAIVCQSHIEGAQYEELFEEVKNSVSLSIPSEFLPSEGAKLVLNPSGSFVLCGPEADTGLTGRKTACDTYGGVASHGGGAFSGKDSTKVDRSAAYMARYAAKNLVASRICNEIQIQVSYAIGQPDPVSFFVRTGNAATDDAIERLLYSKKVFDFSVDGIQEAFSMKTPKGWSYSQAARGPFNSDIFPWEKTDKVELLKDVF